MMRSIHRTSIALTLFYASTTAVVIDAQQQPTASPSPSTGCKNRYTKLPDGYGTYGIDDGGCYYCTANPNVPHAPAFEDEMLMQHCKRMCDSDRDCVAYTVGRAPSLPAQDYYYGKRANCCLERREYPSGVYVDAHKTTNNNSNGKKKKNACQLESMCWTRYEKKKGYDGVLTPAQQKCEYSTAEPSTPSEYCIPVWKPKTYTDEEIQAKIDFIEQGCEYNDANFEAMLAKAHDQCLEEIFAESMSATIIVHPTGMLTRVNVEPTMWSRMAMADVERKSGVNLHDATLEEIIFGNTET